MTESGKVTGGRAYYGEAVGIALFDGRRYPMIPGDVGNASTYDFPVRLKVVKGLFDCPKPPIVDQSGAPPLEVALLIEAAQELERDGVRVRAAWRTHDETKRGPFEGLPKSLRRVRDAAAFECAAYELSQALGLGRVPPTVWRTVEGAAGSLQIWLEEAMPQDDYLEQAAAPPDAAPWLRQKDVMHVFDALIANIDRNQGDILVDRKATLWFIDHSRAFVPSRELPAPEDVTRCSRDLWRAVRDLDEASLRPRLEPFLRRGEIRALFRRRATLVEHIEKLIAARGEAAVLFD